MKKGIPATWIPGAVIALAVFLLFGRGLDYPFLAGWDDDAYVAANRHLAWSLENFLYWWYTPLEGLLTPLTANSLMLDAALWGQGCAEGFRLTNILLHLMTAWLFFSIGRQMRILMGWMCGIVLCWALHVQRLESVLWIAERKDVLAGALTLGAWRLMLCRNGRLGIAGAALCGILAGFAKPAMAPGAAVLILAAAWQSRGKGERQYLLASGLAALLTALAVLPAWCMAEDSGIVQDAFSRKICVITHNFCWYLYNTVLPVDACPVYPRVESLTGALTGALAVGSLLLAAGCAVYGSIRKWFRRYWIWMPVWGAFFFPSCGWRVFSNTDYADRYNYLPSLIFLFCLALMGRDAMAQVRRRLPMLTTAVLILALLSGARAWSQVPVWQNTETLFRAAVTGFSRPNPKALEGLGRLGMLTDRPDLLDLAGNRFLELAVDPPKSAGQDLCAIWQNMGAFYLGLKAYTARQFPLAGRWWQALAEKEKPGMYYNDLYLPVLYGGYADVCLRSGKSSAAQAALEKQMKYVQKEGAAWYRAKGMRQLLQGDEAGALQSFLAAVARQRVPDPQIQQWIRHLQTKQSE